MHAFDVLGDPVRRRILELLADGELTSGATVVLSTSRVARGINEHTLEAFGSGGGLTYRFVREGARWWEGELRTTATGDVLSTVEPRSAPDPGVGTGDPMEIIGKVTIAPLVARFLESVRTGAPVSSSFRDGVRAQAVLDAALESAARGGWVEVAR